MQLLVCLITALFFNFISCYSNKQASDDSIAEREAELERKWGTDFSFTGISTFAHLPHERCLVSPSTEFDIAILGVPFDTAVSYRPGARFGPRAIRAASARMLPYRGFNARAGINPFITAAKIVDCGDVPLSPFDNELALRQMSEAYLELGTRPPVYSSSSEDGSGVIGKADPPKIKIFSLGGDHSIILPALRALRKIYNEPISLLHFDAHLDTWNPNKYPSTWSKVASPGQDGETELDQSAFNHGSMLWLAAREGLIANGTNSNVHAGLRTRLSGSDWDDHLDDDSQGFLRISSDDIDDLGIPVIIEQIVSTLHSKKVYISVDIDVLDPGLAPGTGTPEPGGWTTRELIRILRGIEELDVIGGDVVEVSPAYDGSGEQTALAAAQVVYELLTSVVKRDFVRPSNRGERYASRSQQEKQKKTIFKEDL